VIILRLSKYSHPPVAAVQDVVDNVWLDVTKRPRHAADSIGSDR
jgi:hypothetical protein